MCAAVFQTLHCLCESTADQRERFDQADQTTSSDGTCTDVTHIAAPNAARAAFCKDLRDCCGTGIHNNVAAEQQNDRDQYTPAEQTTYEHVGGNSGAYNVTNTNQRRVNLGTNLTAQTFECVVDFTGNQFQAVYNEFEDSCEAHAFEYGGSVGTAFFTSQQYVCTCCTFGVGQSCVFLYDQRVTQGYHEHNAQDTTAKCDDSNFNKAGVFPFAFSCPQE